MTGNSMDAIDVVMSELYGDEIHDICALSVPYSLPQKKAIDGLRARVVKDRLTAAELLNDNDFADIHRQYVSGIAAAINKLCADNSVSRSSIDAIGFHGKTLDHNPPSRAEKQGTQPFTTQMGSAQMLADMTDIPVINDFRSPLLLAGFEGAPLAAPHNAHIAAIEGDGCYFNAGNTSNLAWVIDGKAVISWDAGPFNEYTDNFVLRHKNENMDFDASYGKQGKLQTDLLSYLFAAGKEYYEMLPPKSGDPAYYKTAEIFARIEAEYGDCKDNIRTFCDIMHTLEYFSAYCAAFALTQTPPNLAVTPHFVLFGGGWKNPLAFGAFKDILTGNAYVLPEHKARFDDLRCRLGNDLNMHYSRFGTYMEARLFADLAYYYLQGKTWPLPELEGGRLVLGTMRRPHAAPVDDFLSKAARGWQNDLEESL